MCLQCDSVAKTLVRDILPGYHLMVSTVAAPGWPEGQFGLVRKDDPDFVWPGDGRVDPLADLSDGECEALPDDDPRWQGSDAFCAYVETIERNFLAPPVTGHRFIEACMRAGYHPDEHGTSVVHWFADRVGRKLAEARSDELAEAMANAGPGMG